VPHDGTPTTAGALAEAMDLAQRSGAELDVLHVPTPEAPTEPGTLGAPQYLDQPQHEWPLWAREFLERTRSLCACPPSVQARLFLRRGAPGAEILRFAQERAGDLIVLAWRGRLEPGRARIMQQVLREAPCPMLVLRVGGQAVPVSGQTPIGTASDRSPSEQPRPHDITEGGQTS
jgi:nucleotide-binding universal stress UspA family protein